MSSLYSSFSKLNVKKMSLLLLFVCKMETCTFPGFESDSIACKNSFNLLFHFLKASDKFFKLNLSDLSAGNLFIISKLLTKKREMMFKIQHDSTKRNKVWN